MSIGFSPFAGTPRSPELEASDRRINIDFSDVRRKSFFPEGFVDNKDPNFRAVKVLECNEDDDLYMYMGMGTGTGTFKEQPLRKFCTGSKYIGQWNRLGMSGKGLYKFPHGVIYDGYFNRNGEFHGTGVLVYPNGSRIEGIWKNGKLTSDTNFITAGGITMSKNYCVMPDRRFQLEIENDFHPPGQEYLTNEQPPPKKIPDGCYDVVEGFFDPRTKTIYQYPKPLVVSRSKTKIKQSQEDIKKAKSMSASGYVYPGDDQKSEAIRKVSLKTESEIEFKQLMKRKMIESKKVVSWIPSITQEDWILKNCRKAEDVATGYRPDLYEEWSTGGAGITTLSNVDENAVDFQSKLESLKLSVNPSVERNDKLLVSFVKNIKETQENVQVDMLSKMFFGKSKVAKDVPAADDPLDTLERFQNNFLL